MALPSAPSPDVLAQFFGAKMADWPALRGALLGAQHLLQQRALDDGAAAQLVSAMLAQVHVPSLVATERLSALQCLDALATGHPGAVRAMGAPLLEGAAAALDGEKEPRCLRAGFSAVASLGAADGSAWGAEPLASAAQELHDQLAAYFPLVYSPPRGAEARAAAVSREALAAALTGALVASPAFAPRTLALALGTLALPGDHPAEAVADALAALRAACASFPPAVLAEHASAAYRALRGLVLPPPPGDAAGHPGDAHAPEAAACLTELLRALGRAPGGAADALRAEALSDPCVADVARLLLAPQPPGGAPIDAKSMRAEAAAHAAGRLLGAVGSASLAAAAAVAGGVLPPAAAAAERVAPDEPMPRMALALAARVVAAAATAARHAAQAAGGAASRGAAPLGPHAPAALALFLRCVATSSEEGERNEDDDDGDDEAPASQDVDDALRRSVPGAVGAAGLRALLAVPPACEALSAEQRAAALAALARAAAKFGAPLLRAAALAALLAAAADDASEVAAAALPFLLCAAAPPGECDDKDLGRARAALHALRQLAAAAPVLGPPAAAELCNAAAAALPGCLSGPASPLLTAQLGALETALFPACAAAGNDGAPRRFAAAALAAVNAAPAADGEAGDAMGGAVRAAVAACSADAQLPLATAAAAALQPLPAGAAALRCAAGALAGLRPGAPMEAASPAALLPLLVALAARPGATGADAAASAAASLVNKAAAGDALAATALDGTLLPALVAGGEAAVAAAAALGALCGGLALRGGARACDAPAALLPLLGSRDAAVAAAAAAAYGAPLRGEGPALSRACHATVRVLWAQRYFAAALAPLLAALRAPEAQQPRAGALLGA